MTRWSSSCLALAGLCACSAIGVVFSQHLARAAWAQISASRERIDELDVDWGRLQIETGTVASHGRVERIARDRLNMTYPELDGSRRIARAVPPGDVPAGKVHAGDVPAGDAGASGRRP